MMRQSTLRQHALRAFTLVELMVASALAFLIVAAGAALASAMARQVREVEEQGDLAARVAIASTAVQNALDGVAYGWRLEDWRVFGTSYNGGPGVGHCVAVTGVCESVENTVTPIAPLAVCSSTGLTHTVCNAADTTSADGIRALVPRDEVSEAIRVVDRNGTPLTTACDAANIPNPIVVDVRGAHQNPWADGDLVLLSTPGHATVGVVRSALAPVAPASAGVTFQLSLALDGANLADDDSDVGDNAPALCNALESLIGARILRVKQVVIRLNGTSLEMSQKPTTAAVPFQTLLSDVEDLQVRLDVIRLTAGGGSQYCRAEGTAINSVLYAGASVNAATCNSPLDRDDPADAPDSDVLRISGLQIGVLLRAGGQTTGTTRPIDYLFDRAPPGPPDQRRRRPAYFFVGLTNAAQY
jgi:type II secretory pathway pseudopilin PulG